MSCTNCQQVSRSFSRRLSHLIWVACNMSITQGLCLGGRAAHCSLRDHQQDVPCRHFAVKEVKRAKLLHGVPTGSQHAPSPPLYTECRAKSPSEQGDQHRPPRAVLVTFYLQFLAPALDPKFLNFLRLYPQTQAGGYSKKGHPKLLPGVMSLQHLTLHVQVTAPQL